MNANAGHAVLASLAGDALAMAPHWIYDVEELRSRFGRVAELRDAPAGSYHHPKKAGDFTHYGDQLLVLLESLAEQKAFDLVDFSFRWKTLFDSYTGYVDSATRGTLSNMGFGWGPEDSGSPSTDLAGAARIAPLAVLPAGDEEALVQAARAQTAMTHNGPGLPDAAEILARSLVRVFAGETPVDALQNAARGSWNAPFGRWVEQGVDSASQDTIQAIGRFGQSCHLDGGFASVAHLVARYGDEPAEALVQSVMAGGDSAARNLAAGMLLGAHAGKNAYAPEWVDHLTRKDHICALLDELES